MEPDNIATIAALAVALVALLVASAQAIQQYFISGQFIRLCDSVVYNQLPGQGHRVWQFRQFRFRLSIQSPKFDFCLSYGLLQLLVRILCPLMLRGYRL